MAQRLKDLQHIHAPFTHATQQIAHLQAKDAQLHSTILALRDRIHSTRACNNCKLYEQQVALLKQQQQERTQELQLALQRMEEEKCILAREAEASRKQQARFRDGEAVEQEGRSCDIDEKAGEGADWWQAAEAQHQQRFPREVRDQAVPLNLRELQEQQALQKIRRRRDSAGNTCEVTGNIEVATHRKASSGHPLRLQDSDPNDPQIALYLKELQEKAAYFEQLCGKHEKALRERDEMKEQDSLRIISQLQEIENYKKELQNMDMHYQHQCAQLQEQQERTAYEFASQIRRQESEMAALKDRAESLNIEKDNLAQLNEAKHVETLSLKRDIAKQEMEMNKLATTLAATTHEHQGKASQLSKIASQLKVAESQNINLSTQIDQQRVKNSHLQQKIGVICMEVEQLRQRCFALEEEKSKNITTDSGQIQYLKKIMEQNALILQNKLQHIQQKQKQQQQLRKTLEQISSEGKNKEALIIQQREAIANLQKEISQLIRTSQSLQSQKAQIQSQCKKENLQKSAFSQKYLLQAERNSQLTKRINALEREIDGYKDNKAQLSSLQEQLNGLKGQLVSKQSQMSNMRDQLQAVAILKEAGGSELQSLKREMEQVVFFNNQMYNDILHFKEENASLGSQINHLQAILHQQQQDLSTIKVENQLLTSDKESLQALNTQAKLQNSRIIEQSTNEKQALLNSIVKLQEDLLQIKQLLREKESSIEQMAQVGYSQAQRISNLQGELMRGTQEKTKLQQNYSHLQEQAKNLHSANESLKKLAVYHPSNQGHDSDSFKSHIKSLQGQLKHLQVKYDSLLQQHDALTESQRKQTQNISYLNEKVNSLNKVYQSTPSESADELARELAKKKQMIAQLLTNFKYIEKALSKKEAEFDQLSEKHEKLRKSSEKGKFEMESKLAAKEGEAAMAKREKQQEAKRNAAMLKDMQRLTHQFHEDIKNKEKIQNQEKKQLQRELARLIEEKKRSEQSSTREIASLRQSLDGQRKKSQQASHSNSPARPESKKEVADRSARISQLQKQLNAREMELAVLRQAKLQDQAHIKEMQTLLTETEVHHDVKEHELQKSKQLIQQLQEQIVSLKAEISNRQAKYHQLQNQDTEKNLANDFLWVQLEQEREKVRKLQGKPKESGSLRMIKQQSLQVTVNSDQSFLNPNSFADLPTGMESIKEEKQQEVVDLPLSVAKKEDQHLLSDLPAEEQVRFIQKKSSSKNLLFQNSLSDVLSESEENDEIKEMVKPDSDSRSHLESSIQVFSEYSRIKSTKSELTHKEVEQHYNTKMKSTMLLAKLGKKGKKK